MSKCKFEYKGIPSDDAEMNSIFHNQDIWTRFMEMYKDSEIMNLRLPLNNENAFRYLHWLNDYHMDDNQTLNFILNVFEGWGIKDKSVAPPTFRELAMSSMKVIQNNIKNGDAEKDPWWAVDFYFGQISQAYMYNNVPSLVNSGIAACFVFFGTWESNTIDFDTISFEDFLKVE